MSRIAFRRGASACALIMYCQSAWLAAATAQQSLPTIDVGARRNHAARGVAGNSSAARPGRATNGPVTAPTGPSVASDSGPRTAAQIWSPNLPNGQWAFVKKWDIPNATINSITRKEIDERVNIVNAQDAVKYFPSLYVGESRSGTQSRLQTRSFAESTERNQIYLDNIPLNPLIGRGGQGGFFGGLLGFTKVISPEEIERVDFITGPCAAQYDGRSMGGVLTYTTKMPDKFKFTAKETVAVSDWNWGGIQRAFPRSLTELSLGDRWNNFSWFITANYQSFTQGPNGWVPIAAPGRLPIYNQFLSWTRTGFPQGVVGSSGLTEGNLVNTKVKLAYDFTPTLRLQHTLGLFFEDRNVFGETLYSNNDNRWYTWFGPRSNANPTGFGDFSSSFGRHQSNILLNALSLRQNTGGVFDFDMSATYFYLMHDVWNTPLQNLGAGPGNPVGGFASTGLVRKETGDYWGTLDLKGIWRPFGEGGAHTVSFGLYGDEAHVSAPTYLSTRWAAGQSSNVGNFYSTIAKGTTRTQAMWLQEVWRLHPMFKLTLGIRGEHWSASDGFNQTATQAPTGGVITAAQNPVYQPYRASTRFSPKGVLEFKPDEDWTITGSFGMANRFPVVSELYALTTPQGQSQPVTPNPYLRPEVTLSKELTIKRDFHSGGWARLSLFHDDVRDFMVSQLSPIPGSAVAASAPANIEKVRNMGVEVDLRKRGVLLEGLEVFANATYVASHIVSNPRWIPGACRLVGGGATTQGQDCWNVDPTGKRIPGLPDWRWKAGFIWALDDRWSFSTNARWASLAWQTTSNNDVFCCGLVQSFQLQHRVFAIDSKINYRWNDRFTFDLGVNNIGNFISRDVDPRTVVFAVRYKFEEGQKGGNGIFRAGDEAGLPDVTKWIRPVAFSID